MKKIDPRLRYFISQESASRNLKIGEGVESPITKQQPDVAVLVRCVGGNFRREDLIKVGMRVHTVIPGFYTVISGEVPWDALESLNKLDFVVQVEASRPMVKELDISCRETRAQYVHQNIPPVKGEKVIVGIVDGGIDYTHPSFRDRNGLSRILYLWDQGKINPDGSVTDERKYTRVELNAALQSDDPLSVVPHTDDDGHGTHVAGIAAGNGFASNGEFTGIAPDADLIVVAYAYKDEEGTLGRSVGTVNAVKYIVDRANGSPVVINISQGMNGGGHSGETVLETALDNLARQPNVVIVKSAGNEQDQRMHAGGQIAQGQTVSLEMDVHYSIGSENNILELWYDGADKISVALQPPGEEPLDFVKPDENQRKFTTRASNQITIDTNPNAYDTGDTCTTIFLSKGQADHIQSGMWKLLIRGDKVQQGRYDVWIERNKDRSMQFLETSADNTRTISIPGTAKRIITVGSYVTRPKADSSQQGKISSFSSRGPTRYGLQKPEITAPGEWIISAHSDQCENQCNPDHPFHRDYRGTSMAAPHVAGAAALILSVRPGLTCEQVKQILMQAAQRQGFASSAPDNTWGSGKLDVARAIEYARTVRFPQIMTVQVNGATLSWQTDVPTTAIVRFHSHQGKMRLGKALGEQNDSTLQTDHTMTLTGLSPSSYYCEIVAFSEDNWWTVDDNPTEDFAEFYVVKIVNRWFLIMVSLAIALAVFVVFNLFL